MADGFVDAFDEYIVQGSLVVDICNLTQLIDSIIGILLGSHVRWLHIVKGRCVILGYFLIPIVLFQKIFDHFWRRSEHFTRPGVVIAH